MEKETVVKSTSGQQYLDKDFSVELNFKLWTTKGARFAACDRLKTLNKLSSYSIGMLSAYLVIIGLLSVFRLKLSLQISNDELAFASTGLSILILVFSQLESANEYRLKAEKYHDCALEISELYNKLRYIKTSNLSSEEINRQAYDLSVDYSIALKKYENHKPIDYRVFQTTKAEYFQMKWIEKRKILSQRYIETKLLYHFLIVAPLLVFYFMFI